MPRLERRRSADAGDAATQQATMRTRDPPPCTVMQHSPPAVLQAWRSKHADPTTRTIFITCALPSILTLPLPCDPSPSHATLPM